MSGNIHRPEAKHPEPYQQDLNPDASKGMNWGLAGPHPEKNECRTAKDVKEVHDLLSEIRDDELDTIPILPAGSRLEANATYLNLREMPPKRFTAGGDEQLGENDLVIPKSEVDYELWNRLCETLGAS
jgi:hypothetical protein